MSNRPSIEYLHEALSLDASTGFLFWRSRPASHFDSQQKWLAFNTRYAGKRADNSVSTEAGYRRVRFKFNGKRLCLDAHRLVFALAHSKWPECFIDHISGDRSDNRPSNLRDVSHAVNAQNRTRANRNNQSGLLGARLNKKYGKWTAAIQVNKRIHAFGWFDSAEEAHQEYLLRRKELQASSATA